MTGATGDAERVLAALAHSVDTVLVVDAEGVLGVVGPSAGPVFGYDPEAVLGTNALDLVHPDDVVLAIDALTSTSTREGRMEPLAMRVRDGWGRWRQVTLVAVNRIDDPDVRGVVLTVRDRTGEKELEAELAARDDRYRQIVELAAEGVWTVDADGRTTFVTARMASMLGYTESEMVGRHLFNFVDEDGRAVATRQHERRRLGISEEFGARFLHRDGHVVVARVSSTPVLGRDGEYLGAIAMVSDVTQLERERERIERAEATHLAMLRAAPDLVFRISADGVYLELHAHDHTELVVPPEQVIGHRVDELLPDELARRVMAAIEAALRTGTVQRLEYVLEVARGVAEFEARVAPINDAEVVTVVRDVSELRTVEAARRELAVEVGQRRVEDRLRSERERAARLESLGRLAGGVAHDINNVLGVIGNHAGALEQTATDPEVLADARAIGSAVRRGSDLTQRLLMLGRGTEPGATVVDLADVVSAAGPTLRSVAPDRRIRLRIGDHHCPVVVDRGRLEQALVNLVVNAADATGPEDPVDVVVERGVTDRGRAVVRLAVRDRGSGMSPEVADRAFEPYFTTKGPDRGTGLGLSVVHGVAVDAGGSVRAEQPAGGGTLVVMEFPAADDPAVSAGSRATGGDEPAQPSVLVVDDDGDALRSVSRLLETCGFRVLVSTSAAEALARLRDADDVDVVLADVVMPGMTGTMLATRLRESRPELPVVLMTAHGGLADEGPNPMVLAKPLVLEEVDRVLRRVVERAAQSVGAREAKARARSIPAWRSSIPSAPTSS